MPGFVKLTTLYRCLTLLFCIVSLHGIVRGQCTVSTRNYANSTQTNFTPLLASVTNPNYAIDTDPSTASVLSSVITIGQVITVTQFISFQTQITAGTPVTVKLGVPASLVSLLGGVTIQPFTGLQNNIFTGWQATAAGDPLTNTSLLGLIGGGGDVEITFTPKSGSTNVAYNGVWVTLSGVAIGQSLKVYDAYVMQTTPTANACGPAIDVLSGVRAGGISLANATGTVTTPTNAIDNDLTTAATLNVGAQVLSDVFLTAVFNSPSQPGDVVRILMTNPAGNNLLSLGALANFTVQLYNGSTAVGSPITSSSSGLLSLSLLTPPSASTQMYLDIKSLPTDPPFDRVDIQLGGLLSAGTSLSIYDIKRIPATPITSMDGTVSSSKSVCQGNTSALSVSNPQSSCTTYNWYSTATGGTSLATGTSYTPPAANLTGTANTYYVEASRTGCGEVSERTPVTININPLPGITYSGTPRTCKGTTAASIAYTPSNSPTTYSIVWDAPAITAGFTNVTNATLPPGTLTVTVPAGAAPNTYTGTITVKNGNGCLSTGAPFSVIVDDKPTSPVLTLAN
ncbi:immunoglobulin domain-containing protein [Mucilaginibacter jinjuensis]|uniref:Ig-like domain-containing protein n=1 Tax=Mucilaginibacter jinjuensis TaxID=1176721 RepID=A0ABY7T5U5_9SPHI|nr:hypothetical protein [Mucilaginibacter jinjuensis]WCT11850.1 hypothetical protein PQO05_24260 [Mucilaginibacter jinjuensis]